MNVDDNQEIEDKNLPDKIPPKEFFEMLDRCVDLHIQIRDTFVRAVDYLRDRSFSDWEILTIVKDYLKDKMPTSTLRKYLIKAELIEESSVEYRYDNEIEDKNSIEESDYSYPESDNIQESELDRQIEAADKGANIIVFNFEDVSINEVEELIISNCHGYQTKTLKKLYFEIESNNNE